MWNINQSHRRRQLQWGSSKPLAVTINAALVLTLHWSVCWSHTIFPSLMNNTPKPQNTWAALRTAISQKSFFFFWTKPTARRRSCMCTDTHSVAAQRLGLSPHSKRVWTPPEPSGTVWVSAFWCRFPPTWYRRRSDIGESRSIGNIYHPLSPFPLNIPPKRQKSFSSVFPINNCFLTLWLLYYFVLNKKLIMRMLWKYACL